MREKVKRTKCSITDCWEQIPETSSMCPACRSWWDRTRKKSAGDLAYYLKRVARFSGRVISKIPGGTIEKSAKKVLRHKLKAA